MSLIKNMLFAAGGGSANWAARLTGTGEDDGYAIAPLAGGGVAVAGYTDNGSNTEGCVAVYGTDGALQWQRRLYFGIDSRIRGVAGDASGNVYVTGYVYDTGGSQDTFIAKYNSSGTLQWQRTLSSGSNDQGGGITVGASGNIYVAGYAIVSSVYYAITAKYDSSGTLQWQRQYKSNTGSSSGTSLACDSSDNVYVGVYDGTYTSLLKYNSSGTLQWQRRLTTGGSATGAYAVAVDPSGNPFVAAASVSGYSFAVLLKYNSSGTLQWQRKLNLSTKEVFVTAATTDSSGNAYVAGYAALSPVKGFIAKYNSSGTLQWQRYLGVSSSYDVYLRAIATQGGDLPRLLVAGRAGYPALARNGLLLAALPLDVTNRTFTLGGTFTISSGALLDITPTYTESAGAGTDAAGTLTDAAGALTDAVGTLTPLFTPL